MGSDPAKDQVSHNPHCYLQHSWWLLWHLSRCSSCSESACVGYTLQPPIYCRSIHRYDNPKAITHMIASSMRQWRRQVRVWIWVHCRNLQISPYVTQCSVSAATGRCNYLAGFAINNLQAMEAPGNWYFRTNIAMLCKAIKKPSFYRGSLKIMCLQVTRKERFWPIFADVLRLNHILWLRLEVTHQECVLDARYTDLVYSLQFAAWQFVLWAICWWFTVPKAACKRNTYWSKVTILRFSNEATQTTCDIKADERAPLFTLGSFHQLSDSRQIW